MARILESHLYRCVIKIVTVYFSTILIFAVKSVIQYNLYLVKKNWIVAISNKNGPSLNFHDHQGMFELSWPLDIESHQGRQLCWQLSNFRQDWLTQVVIYLELLERFCSNSNLVLVWCLLIVFTNLNQIALVTYRACNSQRTHYTFTYKSTDLKRMKKLFWMTVKF